MKLETVAKPMVQLISILILCFFPLIAHCETDYAAGEIAVTFKPDVKEEDAVDFVKRFNLEILRKNGFEPSSLHLNIENDVDAFVKEMRKEPLVSSAVKSEELELNGRRGMVVRVKFKQGAGQDKIEELSLRYRNRREVIGWRYYKSKAPSMVIKVPAGKERYWLEVFNGPEYKDIVDSTMLIGLDL